MTTVVGSLLMVGIFMIQEIETKYQKEHKRIKQLLISEGLNPQ